MTYIIGSSKSIIRKIQMECSICYNEITSTTGKVELSCSHPFHFTCLTTWFNKQKTQGGSENCPLCRHEANEFEKMPNIITENVEDDDNGTFDQFSHGPPDYNYTSEELIELAAQERTRHHFARLKALNPEHEVKLYAANLIKACWRGYHDRLLYTELIKNKDKITYKQRVINHYRTIVMKSQKRIKYLMSTVGLSRIQVKNLAATMFQSLFRGYIICKRMNKGSFIEQYNAAVIFQSLFRGYIIRKCMKKGPMVVELKGGNWKQISVGYWQTVIMNPEEHVLKTIFLHPFSIVI